MVSITEYNEVGISIYPNPISVDNINVELYIDQYQEVIISITDLYGRAVISENYALTAGLSKTKINVSDLENGVYFIKVLGDNLNLTRKIVIQY